SLTAEKGVKSDNLWSILASSDIVAIGDLRFDAVKGTDEYVTLEFSPKKVLKSAVPADRILKVQFYDHKATHAGIIRHFNQLTKKPALVTLVQVDDPVVKGLYFTGDFRDSVRDPDPGIEREIEQELHLQEKIAHDFAPDSTLPHYKTVEGLLESIRDAVSQQTAFTKLEGLGKEGVPAIISQMDDFRDLPNPAISLKNRPGHWESVRHYGPEKVVDALAAILNQLTHSNYRSIHNGGSDRERRACINAWRVHLHHTQNGHNKRADANRPPVENPKRKDE
ncbi:MAG: hypothetical protein Q8M07_11345, partial [Prosthecobacter sp.]|nr:hypothetical protein [Prosthecobacter sp.]